MITMMMNVRSVLFMDWLQLGDGPDHAACYLGAGGEHGGGNVSAGVVQCHTAVVMVVAMVIIALLLPPLSLQLHVL